MDKENRKSIMLTKGDMRKLQVLQKSVMRITTSSRYDTPTIELLRKQTFKLCHFVPQVI